MTYAKPGDQGYNPLRQVNFVSCNDESAAFELVSVDKTIEHGSIGNLVINHTDIIVNHPVIKQNGGLLQVREDADRINDDSPYIGRQVTEINIENMTVTF